MTVYLEYEGQPVPANNLSWAIYSPCGCQSGVMVAQSGTYLVPDEETAWKEYFENATIRKREQKRGYTMKLLKHEDSVKALGGKCPHTPMWGVPDTTEPEGHAWGRKPKAKTVHLVPFAGNKNRPNFHTAKGGSDETIKSLCGQENWSWEIDPWALSDYLTCDKCMEAKP
jgi:hypothetical protein